MADLSLLEEHRSAGSSLEVQNPGYEPNDEERKTIKAVLKNFEASKEWRKKYESKWIDFYKMFRGKQWKELRPAYRHSEVINMIFSEIQASVPIMTDSKPKFEYLPQEPTDTEFAKVLTTLAAADWDKNNWLNVLTECLYDSHIYSTAHGQMQWNQKALSNLGAIEFSSEDIFYCYPDPSCEDINRKSRYFTVAKPVDVDILKKEYPDKAEYLKADVQDLPQGDRNDLEQVRYKSPTDNRSMVEGSSSNSISTRNQALKITQVWYPDEIIEEEKVLNDDSGNPLADPATGQPQKEYLSRKKYPNGRKTVIVNSVVCEDGPNDYEDGLIPFAKMNNYLLPREYYGMGDVEQLESPQKIFNKLVSFSLDVLTLMGNPIWVVGQGAGVDTDNLFNRPGMVVEPTDINQVRREPGVPLQPYVIELIDRLRDWFQGVSGQNDMSEGSKPEGVTAFAAISALQQSQQTRIRQKSRLLDGFLVQLGTLYKNRVLQFYNAPRVFRITNDQGEASFFKFHVKTDTDDLGGIKRTAIMRPFNQNPTTGQFTESLQAKEMMINGDFDVKSTTGSSLPFAKTEKANLGFQLFKAGAIDEPELLKIVDYPNWEAVWARVQERKQQMQQQEMAAQAAAKGGMPPQAGPPQQPPPQQAA